MLLLVLLLAYASVHCYYYYYYHIMPKSSKKGIPKDYKCHFCGLAYTQPGTRNRHIRKKHEDYEFVSEKYEPTPSTSGTSWSANPAPSRPGPSKPKLDVQKVVENIVVKKNSNMIRTVGKKKYYTTDRFPLCIFQRELSVYYRMRDEYLESNDAKYDAKTLWELRMAARNADLADSSREKRKIHINELRLHIILLKKESDLLRQKREFLRSQFQEMSTVVEEVKCEIGKNLERNPSKTMGKLDEIKSLEISVDWIDQEMFVGLDSDSAHWLFDDL